MALKKKPVTGMRDILPAEMQVREYVMNQIRETYRSFGFTQVETPCVEHIENLTSKQGGDNEKLIFKILKRGEKLNLEAAETENDLTDSGLRYDLTLPLSRYYSNNGAQLPSPFKALQMGSVWRADRPQRGRFRQFTQCDIDILGDATNMAEIELILATTTALGRICPKNAFTVRINDRGILKGMALYCGFPEDGLEEGMKTVVSTDGSLGQSNPAGGEDDGMLDNDDGMVDDGMTQDENGMVDNTMDGAEYSGEEDTTNVIGGADNGEAEPADTQEAGSADDGEVQP